MLDRERPLVNLWIPLTEPPGFNSYFCSYFLIFINYTNTPYFLTNNVLEAPLSLLIPKVFVQGCNRAGFTFFFQRRRTRDPVICGSVLHNNSEFHCEVRNLAPPTTPRLSYPPPRLLPPPLTPSCGPPHLRVWHQYSIPTFRNFATFSKRLTQTPSILTPSKMSLKTI